MLVALAMVCGFGPTPIEECPEPPTTIIPAVQGSGLTSPMEGETVTVNVRAPHSREPCTCLSDRALSDPTSMLTLPGLCCALSQGIVTGVYDFTFEDRSAREMPIPQLDLERRSRKLSTEKVIFIQHPTGDGDPATSDGVMVKGVSGAAVGDLVQVTGTVTECCERSSTNTEIVATSLEVCSSGNALPAPVVIDAPPAICSKFDVLEPLEGMLVHLKMGYVGDISYDQTSKGKVGLGAEQHVIVPSQKTRLSAPDALDAEMCAMTNSMHVQAGLGPSSSYPEPVPIPCGGMLDDTGSGTIMRSGDLLEDMLGPLYYFEDDFGQYYTVEVDPCEMKHTQTNPRPDATDVPCKEEAICPAGLPGLLICGVNVLNFFNGEAGGGPPFGDYENRGAGSQEEFDRQQTKLVAALTAMDCDAFGFLEMENDSFEAESAVGGLVTALNAALGDGTYAVLDNYDLAVDGKLGTDTITSKFIYKTATLEVADGPWLLDQSVDPDFMSGTSTTEGYFRPSHGVLMKEIATDQEFLLSINHFKSKRCSCPDETQEGEYPFEYNANMDNGPGCCQGIRSKAARALGSWMDTKGDYPKLLIGDFNAYANEPPIYLLTDSGYSNMVTPYEGEDAYSFVYSGYSGYLDHALAKGSTAEGVSLADSITCVGTWLLNADENPKYDYHLSKYDSIFYYEPTPNRYSDHDPIIIKMCLPVKPDPFR